jgi:hypothetical protein
MSGLARLSPGTVFARDFRVVRPLADGGMGAIYVVEQLSTGNERALKLMLPQLVADEKLKQRFEQEARVGARIKSDHVVQVVAAGVDAESGVPWLAMELLEGSDLAATISTGGPRPHAEVREIFTQLCHALSAAHGVGVVHRDLKPENIFLAVPRREGIPFTLKVLDFGIAKLVAEAQTLHTAPMGSPLWMAPEQTEPGNDVSFATDLWALGLIAFYALTGRLFWKGATRTPSVVALIREIAIEPLPAASARAGEMGVAHLLPPEFDGWFARCVVREPSARFPSAREARVALDAVLSGSASALAMAPTLPAVPQPVGMLPLTPTVHSATPKAIAKRKTSGRTKLLAVGGVGVLAVAAVVGTSSKWRAAGVRGAAGPASNVQGASAAGGAPSTGIPDPRQTLPSPAPALQARTTRPLRGTLVRRRGDPLDVCVAAIQSGPAPPQEPILVLLPGGTRVEPITLVVSLGTRVAFENLDAVPHKLFQHTGYEIGSDAWEPEVMNPRARREWTAPSAGRFEFHDELFPDLTSYIVVDPGVVDIAYPGHDGRFAFGALPPGDYVFKAFLDGSRVGNPIALTVKEGAGAVDLPEVLTVPE